MTFGIHLVKTIPTNIPRDEGRISPCFFTDKTEGVGVEKLGGQKHGGDCKILLTAFQGSPVGVSRHRQRKAFLFVHLFTFFFFLVVFFQSRTELSKSFLCYQATHILVLWLETAGFSWDIFLSTLVDVFRLSASLTLSLAYLRQKEN